MAPSSTSELLKGLRSSSVISSQKSSAYSTRSASPLKSHRTFDGTQSEKDYDYSVSECQPNRRKINWLVTNNWDETPDRISSSRMKAGIQIKNWESSSTSCGSTVTPSYNGRDISSTSNEKSLLSCLSSTRNPLGKSIMSSSASTRSRSSTRSSRSAEDAMEDLDRKIRKIQKALARLENETADLNKETNHLKEINLNIKKQIRENAGSSKRSAKQELAKSVDVLKSQLKDENKQGSTVKKPESYHLSVSTEKRSSYQDDLPELSLSLSDDSTSSMDDFEFEVMSQARCESIRSKSKSSNPYSSGLSTRSCSSTPIYPCTESDEYGSSSCSTRSSSASRTSRPPLPFSSSRRATSPLIVLRGQ